MQLRLNAEGEQVGYQSSKLLVSELGGGSARLNLKNLSACLEI